MDRDLTQTDIAAIDHHLCWSRGPEGVCGGGAVHVEGVRAQAGAGPALLAPAPRPLPLQVQTRGEHRLGPLLLAHLGHAEGLNFELLTINRRSCTITEKAPSRALSWFNAPTSAFTFKTQC